MLHDSLPTPRNHEAGLTVNESSMLARMYNCAAQRVAPKAGSMVSIDNGYFLKTSESARRKSPTAMHDDDEDHFQVVDVGPGSIALWNNSSHRFLVMDPAGRLGGSAVSSTAQLSATRRWAWAKFSAIETTWGGIVLYSKEHDRFLRVTPWWGIADAAHRNRNSEAFPPDRAWTTGDWNFKPFSNSAQVKYELLFNGCCGGPGAPEPVDETPAVAFEECQAQCTSDLSCDAIEVSACVMDSKETRPCRGRCRLFARPAPQLLSVTCGADGNVQCYQKVWKH